MRNLNKREFKKLFVPKPNIEVPLYLREKSSVKELEIGSGDGEFAFYRAKIRPDTYFIAIEKAGFYLIGCIRNTKNNLYPIYGFFTLMPSGGLHILCQKTVWIESIFYILMFILNPDRVI